MARQSEAGSGVDEHGLSAHIVVGEGTHAIVSNDDDGKSVRKRYLDRKNRRRTELARNEYVALRRASNALSEVPGVRSPEPFSIDEDRGELVMERVQGRQLDQAIGFPQFSRRSSLRQTARSLAQAFLDLSDTLSIRELDFSLRNTLVDDAGNLILIDFTLRDEPAHIPEGTRGIEAALASFLTSALTFRVRQSSILNRRAGRRLQYISAVIIAYVSERSNVDMVRVQDLAWQYYWRQSKNRGWKRYVWFHSVGTLMFWKMLGDLTGPASDGGRGS